MPTASPRKCSRAGCGRTAAAGGLCRECGGRAPRRVRRSAAARGYGRAWRRAARAFLADNPFCVQCDGEGRATLAEVVDHIRPHKGDVGLFWDVANWQPLCKVHHDRKTAREDGAFGRQPRGNHANCEARDD